MSQEKSRHKLSNAYNMPQSAQENPIITDLENDKHTELNDSPRETQQNVTDNDLNIKRKRMRRQASDVLNEINLNESGYPNTDTPVVGSVRGPKLEELKSYVPVSNIII
jgi:hypothetical protein